MSSVLPTLDSPGLDLATLSITRTSRAMREEEETWLR